MEEKRPRGRPSKAAGEKKVANLTFRVRPQMRDDLTAAAEASGRSVSEEVEYRLARSFDREDIIGQFIRATFGRNANYMLVRIMAGVLSRLDEELGGDWWETDRGRVAAYLAFDDLTKKWIRPPDDTMLLKSEYAEAEELAANALKESEREMLSGFFLNPAPDKAKA
jgi:hypothetical protein